MHRRGSALRRGFGGTIPSRPHAHAPSESDRDSTFQPSSTHDTSSNGSSIPRESPASGPQPSSSKRPPSHTSQAGPSKRIDKGKRKASREQEDGSSRDGSVLASSIEAIRRVENEESEILERMSADLRRLQELKEIKESHRQIQDRAVSASSTTASAERDSQTLPSPVSIHDHPSDHSDNEVPRTPSVKAESNADAIHHDPARVETTAGSNSDTIHHNPYPTKAIEWDGRGRDPKELIGKYLVMPDFTGHWKETKYWNDFWYDSEAPGPPIADFYISDHPIPRRGDAEWQLMQIVPGVEPEKYKFSSGHISIRPDHPLDQPIANMITRDVGEDEPFGFLIIDAAIGERTSPVKMRDGRPGRLKPHRVIGLWFSHMDDFVWIQCEESSGKSETYHDAEIEERAKDYDENGEELGYHPKAIGHAQL